MAFDIEEGDNLIKDQITCILTFALMGGTYVLPLFLQNMRGYTAMQTGMILFPSAIAVGIMMPVSTSGMNAVPNHLIGKASALSNTIRQIAGSLSVTIMTTIMQSNLDVNYARSSEQITQFNPTAMDRIKQFQGYFMQSGLSNGEAKGTALSVINGLIYKQAYVDAMKRAVGVSVFAVIVAGILVLMMRSKKRVNLSNDENNSVEMADAAAVH